MKFRDIAIKFGIFTGVILILYFLFLGVLGMNANPAYSVVNAPICAVGIALALKDLKTRQKNGFDYRNGFTIGILTGLIATVIFSVFFITYYSYNQSFAEELHKTMRVGMETGPLFLTVGIMGLCTSLVATFALMQLHKRKTQPQQQSR